VEAFRPLAVPRMNVLNTVEREAFESPPVFNSVQRKRYFDFPTELRRLAGELRAPTHQLGFLLNRIQRVAAQHGPQGALPK
jgi:hypothetical protein